MTDKNNLLDADYCEYATEAVESTGGATIESQDGATFADQPPPYNANNFSSGYNQPVFGGQPYGYGNPNTQMGQQANFAAPVVMTAVTVDPFANQPLANMPTPPSYLALSILAVVINIFIGPVAVVFSCLSRSAAEKGDMPKASRYSLFARKTALIGISFTVSFVVTFCVVYFTLR